MHPVLETCRLCSSPTNNQIWCDDRCRKWNSVYDKEMFRNGTLPSKRVWYSFCSREYEGYVPMFSWSMTPAERIVAAIYKQETDKRFISKET